MSFAPRRREAAEAEERARLAPWAARSGESAGRLFAEAEHPYRTAFARDRDRIVHSRAFRRLEYKTQVFIRHEGDHYRNRLTHTLEGAQIARTLARALRLNEDLAEAVVLAHDLGHTPFGHVGERALNELMRGDGGFDHNRQTLRIVDWLERRNPAFHGLNLTFETREGLLKHGCSWPHPVEPPQRRAQPSLEAQVADFSDEIAYLNHDLDDGLRSGLLSLEQLEDVPLWARTRAEVAQRLGRAPQPVLRAQVIAALINRLVTDLVESSAAALAEARPASLAALREMPQPLLRYSAEVSQWKIGLKRFLFEALYHHPEVDKERQRCETALADLYRAFRNRPELLPASVRARFGDEGAPRAIADHLAGMTDRFALAEHAKLQRAGFTAEAPALPS
ncbi:MAG: deoxyguanosinetriphosphate triphosphohydrolase [Deltaproteobacteria bacterium]|nr:deoxyguanosinetriphosphate triphosphohydrolase [Deltaproteobacteria bacterium]